MDAGEAADGGPEKMLAMAVYMGGGPSLMYAATAVAAFEEFSTPGGSRP